MSDLPPSGPLPDAGVSPSANIENAAERAVARAEAAATRRRWITLAELLAMAGVAIAGLTLWNNWSQRRDDATARKAEQVAQAHAAAIVSLVATPIDNGAALALKDPAHRIQSLDITFPADLGLPVRHAVVDTRIDANWFARTMLDLTDRGPDQVEGRLPVLITSDYWDADQHRTDSAIYDIIWHTDGRVLRGRKLRLKGLVLRERSGSAKRLDALWAREKPAN
ncbi:hypothetical protein ACFO8O_10475 [Hephaestia sp. GCM10023244]|uniref:hypothetical protein n=1 Tax=unclassified Hephaestia TaxID=2631281 RepID=UPI00207755F0|nr:hypothetical protein [Hephaestia sp. MAHUQ-44]MCM8731384.1 hypothetical protein [Hephaestia sp. MAHUQ-44]